VRQSYRSCGNDEVTYSSDYQQPGGVGARAGKQPEGGYRGVLSPIEDHSHGGSSPEDLSSHSRGTGRGWRLFVSSYVVVEQR